MEQGGETRADWEALIHHLEAASSYAEQLGLKELQLRIDTQSEEVKTLMGRAGGGQR